MDDIQILNKNLEAVKKAFEAMKKCGIDRELLEIYLQKKLNLSAKKIKQMLDETETFYKKLAQTAIEKEL